jgi:hypothetical protein
MIPSGESLYFSHSTSHSAAVMGGRIPVIGSHSVILKPDSVSRVRPPMMIMPKTSVEQPSNQVGNDRGMVVGFSPVREGATVASGKFEGMAFAVAVEYCCEG